MKSASTVCTAAVRSAFWLVVTAVISAVEWESAFAQTATSNKPDGQELMIRIPRDGTSGGMLTRVCLNGKAGPSPLVVINHGSPPTPEQRKFRKPLACGEVAGFFTSRGYVVAFPIRRGYGETGGAWAETYGKCGSPDYRGGGEATADDIAVATAFLLEQPYVDKGGTVIIGQSAGGWGTLVFASRNPTGIAAFVNFAGGRGAANPDRQQGINCSPDALVASAGELGKTTRQPTLWIYAENDSLINKELSSRMHAAYTENGGKGRFVLLPPFGKEGHELFTGKGGTRIWGSIVAQWLAERSDNSNKAR